MLYYNQYVRAESLEEAYDLYQKKNNLTVQLNQAERLIEAKEEQSSLQKKLEFTTGRYLKARENYLPVKEAYEREFRLFLDTQAGILAEGLKEGMACPVCGSVHHPVLAEKCSEEISKESVDQKKAAADEAEKNVRNYSAMAGSLKEQLERLKKKAEQMEKDAEVVMKVIEEFEGVLPFNDKVSPEIIKREFGLSKNAFKRAVGRLLKQGRIEITENRIIKR